jgi:PAS domain-containing protein
MPEKRAPATPAALRARAEQETGALAQSAAALLSPRSMADLVHELQVHQVELEMQNEELRRAALELEASRERYFELYDLAPVGYLTLSERGVIVESNLTAAGLLGEPRSALVKQPLSRFFLPEDLGQYFEHRSRLLKTREQQACDLQLLTKAAPSRGCAWR